MSDGIRLSGIIFGDSLDQRQRDIITIIVYRVIVGWWEKLYPGPGCWN